MATGNMNRHNMSAYWKLSGVWQMSGRQSNMPKYIQLVNFGHNKMQLINGAFQFASVDIRMGQMSMFYDCFPWLFT